MKVKSESEVTQSCSLLATPWTAAYQAPPSMEFSRQEYWSGVPLPSLIESIGDCQIEVIVLKNEITELQKTLSGFNRRLGEESS